MKFEYLDTPDRLERLRDAQSKATALLTAVEERGYISAGQTEKQLSDKVNRLAEEMFGVRKHWHKRIVRAGVNTLFPYRSHPPDLAITADDILFFDFGPVFEEWEADIGRTYVLGDDPIKHKLKEDVATAWQEGLAYYRQHAATITGAQFYAFSTDLARRMDWEYGGPHCGHLIGNFPHEPIHGEEVENYLPTDNKNALQQPDSAGRPRHWIYEIHFIDRQRKIGGFYEQFLDLETITE